MKRNEERYFQSRKRKLVRHSVKACRDAVAMLAALLDDEGNLDRTKRPAGLLPNEKQFIENEKALCRIDFVYFLTRYAFVKHRTRDILVLFNPYIAQRIMIDIWGQLEEMGLAIVVICLKARQHGISTLTEIAVAHRVIFKKNVNAIIGSSDPGKSTEMSKMIEICFANLPWWMLPEQTVGKRGELIEFGGLNSGISIQHGSQFTGIGRGTTPSTVHLSEVASFINPHELIDASLMGAFHESSDRFMVLESTAEGNTGWWHDTWYHAVQTWPRTKFRPVFLPWFLGKELYPAPAEMRRNPIPANWEPAKRTSNHRDAAELYARTDKDLRKYLGKDWKMSPEQMWWWECERESHAKKKELGIFLQEYCVSGDARISTSAGLIKLRECGGQAQVETGSVSRFLSNGNREVLDITTQYGRRISVTPEHLVALSDGSWKMASDLTDKDTLKLSPPAFAHKLRVEEWNPLPLMSQQIIITEDFGKFLGYFMGDGCFYHDRIDVVVCKKDPDVLLDLSKLTERLFGRVPRIAERNGCYIVTLDDIRLKSIFKELGLLSPKPHTRGGTSGYKRKVSVPECIWRSPKAVVRQFLSALFECDGHAYPYTARTHFFTMYDDFSRDVQLLLLGFGINAEIKVANKKAGDGHVYTGRDVQLAARASDIFHEQIGFISKRKQGGARRKPERGRNAKPHEMEDRVRSVNGGSVMDVYDLTVDSSHSFGANGILVHNCSNPDESFQSTNISAFDTDLIAQLRDETRANKPKAVFSITGDSISPRLMADNRDIDYKLAKDLTIPITAHWNRQVLPIHFNMVPLKFDSYLENPLGRLYVWQFPQVNTKYVIGVDTSDGIGQDRAVVQVVRLRSVFDPTDYDEQVAEFASDNVNSRDLWPLCLAIATWYTTPNQGKIEQIRQVIECNGNGESVQHELHKLGWWNFHPWEHYDNKRTIQSNKIGWYTNFRTRQMAVDTLLSSLRDGWLRINSPWFVEEAQTFERSESTRSLRASRGSFDDRLMPLSFAITSTYIHEITTDGRSFFAAQRKRKVDQDRMVQGIRPADLTAQLLKEFGAARNPASDKYNPYG